MSDLLINWLNDEVQLSKRIINFEDDFHNGYLFGQLLSKYSQQLNFNQFVDKDDKVSRIANFSLLYDTFRTLRVSYDSNIAMAIIQKKTGIAKKLLYELKMQLQKTTSNAFTKLTKPTKPLSPLKKIPLSKDKFDKISKEHFTKQLNEMHRAQKNINLESHLQKFPQFHKKQLMKADMEERKQSQVRLLGQMKFREKQLDNIKKSSDFRNEWEQSNMQKWAANLTVRKIQKEKDQLYKTKIEQTKIQSKTMSELNAIKTLDDDIKRFEKKVKAEKNIPKDSSSDSSEEKDPKTDQQQKSISFLKKKSLKELPKRATESNGFHMTNKSNLSEVNQQEMDLKKKKSPQEVEFTRHQREKKRRKMIVEQSKKQQFIKIERRQKYIVSTLQQNSKQEKEIQYEIWRAWKNKDIITQNKATREEKKKQKEQTRTINAKFKDDELIKTYRQEHNKIELREATDRQEKLRINNSVINRKQIYNECRGFVEKFVDMMQVLYENGQQNNAEEPNQDFVNHLMDEFVADASDSKDIAEIELRNYIKGKGDWNIEITKDSEQQSEDPTEQNSLPKVQVNNYYLGNILKTVFSELYSDKQELQPNKTNSKFLASLMGLDFSGKTNISERIKDVHGFNIIFINKLIEEKIKDYQMMKQRGVQIDGETSEIVKLCFEGKQIPNNLVLGMLKNQIQKHEKCLIVNYPTTYEECIELTNEFGNVKPTDFIKKNKLISKIQEFSKLVWPTEKKSIPRSLKPCGLDLGLWVQVTPKTSLDRFLGRRWTPEGQCLHINEQINNPNTLIVGDKASSTILKNNFKIKNRPKIENWLKSFGIRVIQNEEESVQLCWDIISGEDNSQNVVNNALMTFETALKIKEKKNMEIELQKVEQENKQKKLKELQEAQKEIKEKCVLSNPEQIQKKYQKAIQSIKMGETFLTSIQQLWNTTQKNTINAFLNVFQAIREQDEAKSKYISNTKKKFLRMLTREDQRFFLVKKFQNQYNKFYDDNQDMVNQQYAKQELHQRIQDLEVDLLSLIEEKKDDAVLQCENTMNSGWLENQLEQIVSCMHILLQTQLNRSFSCQQILTDFYSKKYMVPTGDIGETQLILNIDENLELFKDDTFPRLEKLISEANRLFNREQEAVDDKNKKGGKAPPKKDDKKAAKKGGKDEPEEPKQPTPEQLEYKKALNTQKAIFRYRVKVINEFAKKRLKEYQRNGKQLYEDLEDLYKYTDKIEKESVNSMTKIFKQAIQDEKKIENQLQINYTKVIQTEAIRNFEKPKPIIEPASQKYDPDRFSISSLHEIMKFFVMEAEGGSSINNKRLLAIFEHFITNQNYRVLLPENWKKMTRSNFEYFVKKFDPKGNGQIQIWIILEIAALSNIILPTTKQLEQYQLLLCQHNPNFKQISKQKVMRADAWFDSEEPEYINTRKFNRNEHLKSVLFEINRKENVIVLEKYIRRLKLKEFNSEENAGRTYFDFAFIPKEEQ